jgi:hypothetical protein
MAVEKSKSHRDVLKLRDNRQASTVVNSLKAGNLNFSAILNCIYM